MFTRFVVGMEGNTLKPLKTKGRAKHSQTQGEDSLANSDTPRPISRGIGCNLAVLAVKKVESPTKSSDLLPDLLHSVEKWDIDDQLRLLALKERSLVETKYQISELNFKLKSKELELHNLRQVIQSSLYKSKSNKNPREEAINSTRTRRRTLSGSVNVEPPPAQDSKLWNGLQKPLNFLNQVDAMLLNEFEKSLRPSDDSQSYKDDVFQSVSTSLWSFVNDVKTNVMSSLTEDGEYNGKSVDDLSAMKGKKLNGGGKIQNVDHSKSRSSNGAGNSLKSRGTDIEIGDLISAKKGSNFNDKEDLIDWDDFNGSKSHSDLINLNSDDDFGNDNENDDNDDDETIDLTMYKNLRK